MMVLFKAKGDKFCNYPSIGGKLPEILLNLKSWFYNNIKCPIELGRSHCNLFSLMSRGRGNLFSLIFTNPSVASCLVFQFLAGYFHSENFEVDSKFVI